MEWDHNFHQLESLEGWVCDYMAGMEEWRKMYDSSQEKGSFDLEPIQPISNVSLPILLLV